MDKFNEWLWNVDYPNSSISYDTGNTSSRPAPEIPYFKWILIALLAVWAICWIVQLAKDEYLDEDVNMYFALFGGFLAGLSLICTIGTSQRVTFLWISLGFCVAVYIIGIIKDRN